MVRKDIHRALTCGISHRVYSEDMGTNFYTRENECKHCERYEDIHLGKSSAGWQFSFQYNGGKYYKNVEEMKGWLKDKEIRDEYNEKISYEDFWQKVESKKDGLNHTTEVGRSDIDKIIDGYSFSDCEFSYPQITMALFFLGFIIGVLVSLLV